MKVTPLDIRRKEFRRSVRGYLDEDVDIFLDVVADEVEQLSKANSELEAKVRSLEAQAVGRTNIGEALEKTLVTAQLQADEIKAKAENESQAMLREAEAKAKSMVDEFYSKTQTVQQTLMRLKLLEADFRSKFKGLLEEYLTSLDEPPLVSVNETQAGGADAVPRAVPEVAAANAATSQAMTPAVAAPEAAPAIPQPPELPQTEVVTGTPASADDDQTLEVGASETQRAQTEQTPAPPVEAPDQREGSVYFGKKTGELDDPFPDIGGASAKPRDFAW